MRLYFVSALIFFLLFLFSGFTETLASQKSLGASSHLDIDVWNVTNSSVGWFSPTLSKAMFIRDDNDSDNHGDIGSSFLMEDIPPLAVFKLSVTAAVYEYILIAPATPRPYMLPTPGQSSVNPSGLEVIEEVDENEDDDVVKENDGGGGGGGPPRDDQGAGGQQPDGSAPSSNETSATDWNQVLLTAAEEGDVSQVELALNNGANIETMDAKGRTALRIATFKWHVRVVELLLDKGASQLFHSTAESLLDELLPIIITIQGHFSGNLGNLLATLIALLNHGGTLVRSDASFYFRVHNLDFIQAVLNNLGENLNQFHRVHFDNTPTIFVHPVHMAVYFGTPEVLEVVCNFYPDAVNLQGGLYGSKSWKPYPLNLAAWQKNVEMCQILLSHGAKVARAHGQARRFKRRRNISDEKLQLDPNDSPEVFIFQFSHDSSLQEQALEQVYQKTDGQQQMLLSVLKSICKGNKSADGPLQRRIIAFLSKELLANSDTSAFIMCAKLVNQVSEGVQGVLCKAAVILQESGAIVTPVFLYQLTGEGQFLTDGVDPDLGVESCLKLEDHQCRVLYFALQKGAAATRMLLALGADPNSALWVETGEGCRTCIPTPLSYAAKLQRADLVRVLLQGGALLSGAEYDVQ